jgi:carboxymethylenebutenolidase
VAAVVYADAAEQSGIAPSPTPVQQHLAGTSTAGRPMERAADGTLTRYWYPSSKTFRFAVPFEDDFNYASEAVSHTRNLTFLKPLMDGPYFDLETIWNEHTYYEFEDRSVEHTMSTMVQEPYVNHIPTVGHQRAHAMLYFANNLCSLLAALVEET